MFKSGGKTGVNIDSKIWLDHKFEDQSHMLVWVQFLWKKKLPICQDDSQKYGIGQVQYVDLEKLVIQFHDEWVQDSILAQESY